MARTPGLASSPPAAGDGLAAAAAAAAIHSSAAIDHGYDPVQVETLARYPPPGATVYVYDAPVSTAVNPRSCLTCRRRKVRCDKHMPCANCRRAHLSCIFPPPGRAPRRPRPRNPNAGAASSRPGNGGSSSNEPGAATGAGAGKKTSGREMELMSRLKKLEDIVEDLSSQLELDASGSAPLGRPAGDNGTASHVVGSLRGWAASPESGRSCQPASSEASVAGRDVQMAVDPRPRDRGCGSRATPSISTADPSSDMQKKLGRLMLTGQVGSRSFWERMNDELDELRRDAQSLSADESDDDNEYGLTPESAAPDGSDHQTFIWCRSHNVGIRPLHPPQSQIFFLWHIFLERVNPFFNIVHSPTMTKLVHEIQDNSLNSLSPAHEALMFSIYHAAIISMDATEVQHIFNTSQDALTQRYRFGIEQALAKADFLGAPNLTVCQAFALFLFVARRYDETRLLWSLTGLLARLSQSLGLHRDGTNFPKLTPFEAEMRRRLFFAILCLDLRFAEDHGNNELAMPEFYDTRLPVNIDDSDMHPDMTEPPKARKGPTDMIVMMTRIELSVLGRPSSASALISPHFAQLSLQQREALVHATYTRIKENYFGAPGADSKPLHFFAAKLARLIVVKMTLDIYQPSLLPKPSEASPAGQGPVAAHDINDARRPVPDVNRRSSTSNRQAQDLALETRLFACAIEAVDSNRIIKEDPRTKPWRWAARVYPLWYFFAYLLIGICNRPLGPLEERAWVIVSGALASTDQHPWGNILHTDSVHASLLLVIRKLHAKARRHRDAEIARLRADPQAAISLELEDSSWLLPSDTWGTADARPGSPVATTGIDQWRKLVNAPSIPQEALDRARRNNRAERGVQSQEASASGPGSDFAHPDNEASGVATNALCTRSEHDFMLAPARGQEMLSGFTGLLSGPWGWAPEDSSVDSVAANIPGFDSQTKSQQQSISIEDGRGFSSQPGLDQQSMHLGMPGRGSDADQLGPGSAASARITPALPGRANFVSNAATRAKSIPVQVTPPNERPPWMWSSMSYGSVANAQAADHAAAATAKHLSGSRQGAYPADPFRAGVDGDVRGVGDVVPEFTVGGVEPIVTSQFPPVALGGNPSFPEDIDMGMEDDFNWQDLEQALGRFQENDWAAGWGPRLG